jgi:hypothetical protein
MQTELLPFLLALSILWISGPSEAAARYRRLTGVIRAPTPQEQALLSRFERVVGAGTLEAVRQAERLEPLLLGTLDETSTRLWSTPYHGRVYRLVRALLELSCWRAELPGPEELDRVIPQSTQALLPIWQRWQAGLVSRGRRTREA